MSLHTLTWLGESMISWSSTDHMVLQYKSELKQQGQIIADMDLMIASIATANQKILVTNNAHHFERIKKLKLENWSLL